MAIPFRFPNHGRANRPEIMPRFADENTPMYDGFFADNPLVDPVILSLLNSAGLIEPLDYSGDIRITLTDGEGGFGILQNDLSRDPGLESAILISLFSDRRADIEDALPDSGKDLRGWWGDATQGDKIGSRLWLLSRSKIEDATASDAERYCLEALQWMIDDGVADSVEVTVSRTDTYTLEFSITVARPKGAQDITFKYFFNWEAQSLRRG